MPELDAIQEELTAYLDGELDAAARQRVEQRLARDAAYRAELQRLESAWDLLDGLNASTVDETFGRSTLELVAVAAAAEAQQHELGRPQRRRRAGLFLAGGLVALGVAGYLVGRWSWPDPNEALLRDLPVLEHLDLYRHADSVDFLEQLENERVFDQEAKHAG